MLHGTDHCRPTRSVASNRHSQAGYHSPHSAERPGPMELAPAGDEASRRMHMRLGITSLSKYRFVFEPPLPRVGLEYSSEEAGTWSGLIYNRDQAPQVNEVEEIAGGN